MGILDLSGGDIKGFDALDAGRLNAEVVEITMDAVKNEGGKTPVGTPIIKFQFKSVEPDSENRRFWDQFTVPPKGYDEKKAKTMKGMIARVFIALGDKEEDVLSPKFNPDFEDYKGRPCVIVIGKEPKKDRGGNVIEGEYSNPVKGVKPAGSKGSGDGAPGGLL